MHGHSFANRLLLHSERASILRAQFYTRHDSVVLFKINKIGPQGAEIQVKQYLLKVLWLVAKLLE
jgi:hypothetical protein